MKNGRIGELKFIFLYSAESRRQMPPDENDIAGLMAGVKQAKTGSSAILSPFGKGGLAQASKAAPSKTGRQPNS